jgi:hypothetical protein
MIIDRKYMISFQATDTKHYIYFSKMRNRGVPCTKTACCEKVSLLIHPDIINWGSELEKNGTCHMGNFLKKVNCKEVSPLLC